MLTKIKFDKILEKFKLKKNIETLKVNDTSNVVEFPSKFIPLLLNVEVLNEQTIHLTEYFRSSKDIKIDLEDKEKQPTKIIKLEKKEKVQEHPKKDKEERYKKFMEYLKLHSSEDGKILVKNADIIKNLNLTRRIVEVLKSDANIKGDLIVKNGKSYINLK